MNYLKTSLLILFICCAFTKVNAQYINIDDQKTPQQLIENILVNSSCVSVTNTSGTGDAFTPGHNSFAYFSAGTSSFPFSEGIVLTTSTSANAIGPYVKDSDGGGSVNWLGDADLNQTLGINSVNATVLEFDFVPLTDFLNFNYIFASNEYQYDYPCSYSDGFAFLIREAGTSDPYKNLAVIPNTTTPVSSVNIHPTIAPGIGRNGDSYAGCPEKNPTYFNGFNPASSPVNYTAQTVVMNAQTNVTAGKTYHIKLVIADDRNRYYDSAVFLQAGSFVTQINLGPDQTVANNDPVCFGTTVPLNTNLSPAYTYKWFKDNVEIIGANGPLYNAAETGTYRVEAVLTPSTCQVMGQIKLEFAPEILSTNTTLVQCDDNTDGFSIFNLTKADNIVKNNVATISNKGYYESLANAQAETNPISTPDKYTNKSQNQIVYARLENQYGCYKIAQVTLQISNNVIADQNLIKTCDADGNQDGLYQFDLNAQVTPQLTSGLPSGLTVNYYLTANDAVLEVKVLPNIFKNTTAYAQTIYARVVNGADCYDITPIPLVVNTFDPPNFQDESKYLCKDDEITLTAAAGFTSYLWNTGSTANFIEVNAIGDYSVTVKDANGCEKTKNFKVLLSEPAVITNAVVKDFSGTDNSVLIEYTGTGDYEFSLDGVVYQTDPLFTGLNPGTYYAIARDKNGCGLSNSFTVYVLDYPRFFTPNGDGYNDLWAIKDIDQLPDYTIYIFDRYGKFLKQMNQNSVGWNGIFNGQQLPSDDYWFTLTFVDGKNVKGHFSLKR
ncbi:choice-of-anchor L domain-containing protein [Flavobacterium sp. MC2016-06]|uniref:T9SS type B sorting domain-containing protein n=1 Tax=Flavobacterium sp. MC2016-06 TaxID=2676308 RepID=UPI0012BA89FD|nr:choice-of-anchor L domain-containing protein [Flavobacterium sp. MC2016-06]MBU3861324.1 T9SS type B sorting domain-containing protein [Flavobacterium sp. MC2016-06]